MIKSIKRLFDRCIQDALEAKLIQWAKEYGYGKADDIGYASVNQLQRLHDHAGWLPPPEPVRAPIRTEADRTNAVFVDYEINNYNRAQVLKNYYFRPHDYMPCRLVALKKIGIQISSDTYSRWLNLAHDDIRVLLLNK